MYSHAVRTSATPVEHCTLWGLMQRHQTMAKLGGNMDNTTINSKPGHIAALLRNLGNRACPCADKNIQHSQHLCVTDTGQNCSTAAGSPTRTIRPQTNSTICERC